MPLGSSRVQRQRSGKAARASGAGSRRCTVKPHIVQDAQTLYILSRHRARRAFRLMAVGPTPSTVWLAQPIKNKEHIINSPSETTISLQMWRTPISGIAPPSVVLTMETATGNIWMLDNVGRAGPTRCGVAILPPDSSECVRECRCRNGKIPLSIAVVAAARRCGY